MKDKPQEHNYNYRIFNQHLDKGVEVVSLMILTDEDKNYRPDEYHVGRWGFDLRMKFPLVKLIDYRDPADSKGFSLTTVHSGDRIVA